MAALAQYLTGFHPQLVAEISAHGVIKQIPADQEILREGQYVQAIPLVVQGLIKVFTRYEERELLLYYIKPQESCIMSFSAGMKAEPSTVFAITEEDTQAILLPVDKVSHWTRQFPDINTLFFQQYNLRYTELLDTIHHVMFNRMDQRLFEYLREKVALTQKHPIKLSHRIIANELGTAREVISRVLKKLESEGRIRILPTGIELLDL